MKNQKKLIVIVTMIALLMCVVFTYAIADEKIYTSPTFKLPADQIMDWAESEPEEEVPEEGTPEEEVPAEAKAEEGEPAEDDWGEDAREEDSEDYVPEDKKPAEGTEAEGETPAEGTTAEGKDEEGKPEGDDWGEDAREEDSLDYVPEGETPAEGTAPEGEAPEEGTAPEGEVPAEGTAVEGETPAEGTEAQSEEGNLVGETVQPERSVQIRSSQGDVVTEGEIIYLSSKLKGFDGLDIAYQWQVDRGDGAGWVDVEGANRSKHMFVADRETIQYSWRLVVTVVGEE